VKVSSHFVTEYLWWVKCSIIPDSSKSLYVVVCWFPRRKRETVHGVATLRHTWAFAANAGIDTTRALPDIYKSASHAHAVPRWSVMVMPLEWIRELVFVVWQKLHKMV